MEILKNYINGKLVAPSTKQYFDNIEPATGKVFSRVPNSQAADVNQAAKSAEKSFPLWVYLSAEKRMMYLNKIADYIEKHAPLFAQAESQDNGKSIALAAQVDIPRAIYNLRFFASAGLHFSSESHSVKGVGINYTLRQAIGVVGCISPWNLPLYLFTWKIAPALAAGNCVVAKPSEITPYTAYLFSKACIHAKLPAGILNIVHGTGQNAGNAIVNHPKIKAISFTGGTQTGKIIAQNAAGCFKKFSLELGGKNPALVFDDCEWEYTIQKLVKAAFSNQGEICLCASRIFIQQNIYEKFKSDFVAQVLKLKVGDPKSKTTDIGAIVSKAHHQKILDYIQLAKAEGGKILCGGQAVILKGRCNLGYFISPTVVENLDYRCQTNQEEIFGPMVTLLPFASLNDAIQMANATPYGLAATIWTKDLQKAHQAAEQIDAGIVWINDWMQRDLRTPFGGMKNSGVGREGGWDALRFFTESKNIFVNTSM